MSVVTDAKVLGANYGFVVAPAFTNSRFELPGAGIDDSNFGFSDLYVVPIQLGWHLDAGADIIASYGFFAPTGRYSPDADDNIGLGMWSHEFALGTTLLLGDGSWYAATTGFYEVHSKKENLDLTVGDILALEGGGGEDAGKRHQPGRCVLRAVEDDGRLGNRPVAFRRSLGKASRLCRWSRAQFSAGWSRAPRSVRVRCTQSVRRIRDSR